MVSILTQLAFDLVNFFGSLVGQVVASSKLMGHHTMETNSAIFGISKRKGGFWDQIILIQVYSSVMLVQLCWILQQFFSLDWLNRILGLLYLLSIHQILLWSSTLTPMLGLNKTRLTTLPRISTSMDMITIQLVRLISKRMIDGKRYEFEKHFSDLYQHLLLHFQNHCYLQHSQLEIQILGLVFKCAWDKMASIRSLEFYTRTSR